MQQVTSVFYLPRSDERRKLWMSYLVPTNSTLLLLTKEQLTTMVVCEKHFERRHFDAHGRRLQSSYPTLFSEAEIARGEPLPTTGDESNLTDQHNYCKGCIEDDVSDSERDTDSDSKLVILKPDVVADRDCHEHAYCQTATTDKTVSLLETVAVQKHKDILQDITYESMGETSTSTQQAKGNKINENVHCMTKKKAQTMGGTEEKDSHTPSNKLWWMTFGVICFATFATRYYKVLEPDHVCWDETHFGKMASWYINRTFFFDVHPPLGKMLIALSGKLSGYDGTYPFDKPGDKYDGARYEGMRIFCTTLGALIIPITFLTIWEMTKSLDSSVIGTLLLLFDVGFLTLNRYILLDPILLFFMSCSIYGAFKVSTLTVEGLAPLSRRMVSWQLLLGLALACTMSVKFVGLFVVLFAGVRTLADLWGLLGDLEKPVSLTVKHLMGRAITLILWPIMLYVFFFWIHLTVLSKSGNGDGFYSSGFQARLEGNSLHNASAPRVVAYGARVTLKNHRTGGGYLHSHHHLYPQGVGARQQQITTYTHKDENNRFVIKPYDREQVEGTVVVRSGDLVRLTHAATGRNLHSHRERAPLTSKYLQVTGYGEDGIGDANDVWKIMISGGKDGDEVQTVRSKLMFVHYLQSCVLTTSGKQLPKWGYEQQEVGCNPNLRDRNALWNVEDNVYDGLPKASFESYASGFFERLVESHAVMLQGNAGLKPKEGEVTSQPWQWPINYRGQFFSGSAHRVYLLGNPVVWWANLAFLVAFTLIYLLNKVHEKRAQAFGKTVEDGKSGVLLNAAGWSFLGWAMHYVPFWAMGRVLYFHHYFPALQFSAMLTGILTEYLLRSIRSYLSPELGRTIYHGVMGVIISTTVYSFYLFAPLAYGMNGPLAHEPNSTMAGLKWLESWEF